MSADELVNIIKEASNETHQKLISEIRLINREELNRIVLKLVYTISILREDL